jgi:hypothetical protein
MTETAIEVAAPAGRIQRAALWGLLGSLLTMVSWALALSDPAEGTGRWYAAYAFGALATLGLMATVAGMYWARETAGGVAGRTFLVLWELGLLIMTIGAVVMFIRGNTDTVLFPIGFITAVLGSLIASIFIACNRRLTGLRRWAPLIYIVGSFAASVFQGEHHTLQVNLADLAVNLLTLLMVWAFFQGVRE